MTLQKNQEVYFKRIPRLIYGKVVNIIDEGHNQDPSVVVQPDEIRCHASDLESAELPESPTDKAIRILSNPLGLIPEQWALHPESKELQSKMLDLLRELDWIKKLPTKE